MGIVVKWYKRDPEAFKGGTLGLTLEETGAYTLLLDDIYARDGNVPDNVRYLCRLWRCDPRVARRIRGRLLELKKLQISGQLLTNLRATYELSTADVTSYLKAESQQNQQNGPIHPEYRSKKKERARARDPSRKFTTIQGGRTDGKIGAVEACDRLIERLGGKPGAVDYDPTEDGSFGLSKG